jgi:hypothetical protein
VVGYKRGHPRFCLARRSQVRSAGFDLDAPYVFAVNGHQREQTVISCASHGNYCAHVKRHRAVT